MKKINDPFRGKRERDIRDEIILKVIDEASASRDENNAKVKDVKLERVNVRVRRRSER